MDNILTPAVATMGSIMAVLVGASGIVAVTRNMLRGEFVYPFIYSLIGAILLLGGAAQLIERFMK